MGVFYKPRNITANFVVPFQKFTPNYDFVFKEGVDWHAMAGVILSVVDQRMDDVKKVTGLLDDCTRQGLKKARAQCRSISAYR